MRDICAILLSTVMGTLTLLSVSGTAAETPASALDAACEKACATVDQEIAAWTLRLQEAETRMLAAEPEAQEAAARVLAALRAEKEARKSLLEADRQAVTSGTSPAQPIHLPRPYNELAAETGYAERMIGILAGELEGVKRGAPRVSAQVQEWQKAAGADPEKVARIVRWTALHKRQVELTEQALALYRDRARPGWYDRANLAGKYDLPMIQLQVQVARAAIAGAEPWREKQLQAALSLITAGRTTTESMAAFNARMTRETPLVEQPFDETLAVPGTIWDLARLAKPPACRWLVDVGPARQLLFQGELYQGLPTAVFAYYASPGTLAGDPALDKNLPALVLVHGGGDRASSEWVTFWAKHGYAAISMDLAGCGPNTKGEYDKLFKPERLLRGGPGQDGNRKIRDINLPLTDQWPYHAVANVILAHSLISSLPGVDPERTAVAGISWGGYLTCIAAGVDSRFKAAMPFYGCGFLAENSVWKDQGLFTELGEARARRWTELWDPSRYAGKINVPVFAVTGAQDFAYPLESFANTYALPKGPVQFRVTPDMGHGGQFLTTTPEAVIFMDSILRGGAPLPCLRNPQITGGTAAVQIRGGPVIKAQFHYTSAKGPNKTREWKTVAAAVADGVASAPLPSGPIALAYFTATAANNITVSSGPFPVKGPL